VHHAHGAVTLGSEIAGGIRNLVANNITCDGTQMGVSIKSRRDGVAWSKTSGSTTGRWRTSVRPSM